MGIGREESWRVGGELESWRNFTNTDTKAAEDLVYCGEFSHI